MSWLLLDDFKTVDVFVRRDENNTLVEISLLSCRSEKLPASFARWIAVRLTLTKCCKEIKYITIVRSKIPMVNGCNVCVHT